MKKSIGVLLVVQFLVMSLAGCAKKDTVKTEEPVTPAVTAAPEPAQAVPAPVQPAPAPAPAPQIPETKTAVVLEPIIAKEPDKKAVLETIHFDFDKSDLREPDREILTKNAGIMMSGGTMDVLIEGHCDERGSAEYNLALGERRAGSAMKYLVTLGVPADRLSIISYGEEKPVDPGHDEDAWAKNRRAEFVITGK
ncbi:MAG: peptidoglycan-associated lipoprotein Pal [Desulfuromonadaceae bacterium]|nr:peptidoglycan-associated lipoprotein Pal [Desulfuromonadaceae bacterium]